MTLLLRPDIVRNDRPSEDGRTTDMVRIPGGTFRMGSDKHYAEEAPAHPVTLDGIWIDRTPVANRQFTRFVIVTGHKINAEIPPAALHAEAIDISTSHLGFRCVKRTAATE
jgi:sulfatase modifying factor 1